MAGLRKAAKTLTAAAVQNYRPRKARREIPDGGCRGLYLVVQPTGQKSWALRFRRPGGTSGKLTLGPCDLTNKEATTEPVLGMPLTLVGARRVAVQVHRARAMGQDVVADRRVAKQRQRAEAASRVQATFAAAARDFIQGHAMRRTHRWREQARLLGLQPTAERLAVIPDGLVDRWATKPVAALDAHDIHGVVDEARERGVPGLARRSAGTSEARAQVLLSCLSKMFTWLRRRRRVETNPCVGIYPPAPPQATALTNAEKCSSERPATQRTGRAQAAIDCRVSDERVCRDGRAELSEDCAT